MTDFELDSRLASDCHVLGRLDYCLVLLMNNSMLPWFILVPQTSEKEIIDLSLSNQARLMDEVNLLADFIREHFEIAKLNIAAIGNVVSQLHVHIVGRSPSDYCWPRVVWGTQAGKPYTVEQVNEISARLKEVLGARFT